MKYFIYEKNFFGHSRVVQTGLTKEQAIRIADELYSERVDRPLDSQYEVYREDQEPEYDKPVFVA